MRPKENFDRECANPNARVFNHLSSGPTSITGETYILNPLMEEKAQKVSCSGTLAGSLCFQDFQGHQLCPGLWFEHLRLCTVYTHTHTHTHTHIYRERQREKEMTTHSNILAWRIPWTDKPGELLLLWSQRVGHK